jgi:hypothetical protein
MDFELFPKSDDILLVGTTNNVQYKVAVRTEPKNILVGSDATVLFKIYDIFLAGKPISVDYDLVVESNGKTLYETKGKSIGEKAKWDEIRLTIPKDASGKLTLYFENLGGNGLARTEIPIAISSQIIPSWIKNNAGWWCKKSISDDEFLKGIEFLMGERIIPVIHSQPGSGKGVVPSWVRSGACWWSDGLTSDTEFINAITFLVKSGLIKP